MAETSTSRRCSREDNLQRKFGRWYGFFSVPLSAECCVLWCTTDVHAHTNSLFAPSCVSFRGCRLALPPFCPSMQELALSHSSRTPTRHRRVQSQISASNQNLFFCLGSTAGPSRSDRLAQLQPDAPRCGSAPHIRPRRFPSDAHLHSERHARYTAIPPPTSHLSHLRAQLQRRNTGVYFSAGGRGGGGNGVTISAPPA
jgi:hypothetical protein